MQQGSMQHCAHGTLTAHGARTWFCPDESTVIVTATLPTYGRLWSGEERTMAAIEKAALLTTTMACAIKKNGKKVLELNNYFSVKLKLFELFSQICEKNTFYICQMCWGQKVNI